MSNRNLAFLILLGISLTVLGFIYYFFIANVGSIVIDVGEYKGVGVELKGEFQNNYSQTCDNTCTLNRIPPINYVLNISKEGYKKQSFEFKLSRGEAKTFKILLSKDTQSESVVTSKDDKIAILKYNKLIASKSGDIGQPLDRKVIGTFNSKVYSYSLKNSIFSIYESDGVSERELYTQKEISVDNLVFNKVEGLIFYSASGNNYFFDIKSKSDYKINIGDKILFVKRTPDSSKYIVDMISGIYIYNTSDNTYTKNTLFDDIVVLKSGKILGLIYASSKDKMNILNFTNDNTTKLILHTIETRERKIIYQTTLKIKYLFEIDSEIKYLDENMNLFNLKQLDL